MSDINSEIKQPKNRLAVFEHLRCKEKKSKNYNLRKPTNRSLISPVADLIIDDDDDDYGLSQPPKRRNIGVPMQKESLNLVCGWSDCSQVFKNYNDFLKHLYDHFYWTGDLKNLYACQWEDCTYTTQLDSLLQQHIFYHGYHTRVKNIGDNVVQRNELPECNRANDFVFPESVHGYSCEWYDCDARFLLITDFFMHMQMHVNSNPKYCEAGEVITCYWGGCTYKFNSQYKLSDHVRTHTKERVVACSTCGSMFSTKTKFHDHRKRQLPKEMKGYQCSQCTKLFGTERLLSDHIRSHINHYKCTMCDMTCPKPSALATHIRYRHISDRPVECKYCQHSCVSKQDLITHLRTHSTEKLLLCDECNYKCRSRYGLAKHKQKEHDEDSALVYECHWCQRRFGRGNYLTRHLIRTHNFHWPSGHSRFRYKANNDGIYRLQTVRYESIEVTQEMMRASNHPPPTQGTNEPRYNLRKQQQSSDKTPKYVLMIAENGEQNVVCNTKNSIVITINDVDESGNIVSSEIVESNEMKIMDASAATSTNAPEERRCLRPRKVNSK